jgi:LemA family
MTVVIVILVIVALGALSLGVSYNRLVTHRVMCSNSWANVDTELKRRYDLVPNLVSTVQGDAAMSGASSRRSRGPDPRHRRRKDQEPRPLPRAPLWPRWAGCSW